MLSLYPSGRAGRRTITAWRGYGTACSRAKNPSSLRADGLQGQRLRRSPFALNPEQHQNGLGKEYLDKNSMPYQLRIVLDINPEEGASGIKLAGLMGWPGQRNPISKFTGRLRLAPFGS